MGIKAKVALWGTASTLGPYAIYRVSDKVYNSVGETVARNLPPIRASLESFMMRSLQNMDSSVVNVGNSLDDVSALLVAGTLGAALFGTALAINKYVIPGASQVGSSVRNSLGKLQRGKGKAEAPAEVTEGDKQTYGSIVRA